MCPPDDVSLQEPLIQFTYPLRDDRGWQLLEGASGSASNAEQHTASSEATTELLQTSGIELALVEVPPQEGLISESETAYAICKKARQAATELEQKADESWSAASNSQAEGRQDLATELRYQAAGYAREAEALHSRAASLTYAANNRDLSSDMIDLRGLRACEVEVVRKVLETAPPQLPAYQFVLEPNDKDQERTLADIARSLSLAFYHDGNITHIVLKDKREYQQDLLVDYLKRRALDSTML